jgi:hypothetical protein
VRRIVCLFLRHAWRYHNPTHRECKRCGEWQYMPKHAKTWRAH